MDRLEKYLFSNYGHLLTLPERAAWKAILLEEKAENSSPAKKEILAKAGDLGRPEIQALLADGSDSFFQRVKERLLSENSTQIELNHCPRCGALARTPTARQCPDCYCSWH